MRAEKVIERFVKEAKRKLGDEIESIILFGSYARGEASKESDIDILVIVKKNGFEIQKKLSEISAKILLESSIYISAKAITKEEYELMKKINSGFYQNIVKEGAVIG